MAQERLLADLRDSVKPLERCKAEGRGTEHLNGALARHPLEEYLRPGRPLLTLKSSRVSQVVGLLTCR